MSSINLLPDETFDGRTLSLRLKLGDVIIQCAILGEALDGLAGLSRGNHNARLRVFRENRSRFHAIIDRKLGLGEFELDASIVVKADDLERWLLP